MKQVHDSILHIDGMHCTNCEKRISAALKRLSGVEKVTVSFVRSVAEITYDSNRISLEKITKTIEQTGYTIRKPGKKFGVKQISGLIAIIAALYLLIQSTVGFNYIPEINQSMGYGIIFIIGVLTSLHCIAMCGGINLSQCIHRNSEEEKRPAILKPSIFYNIGRIISYTIIGGLAGSLGSVLSFSDRGKGFIAIIAGVFMLVMGLKMLNIPWIKTLHIPLPQFLHRFQAEAGQFRPFYIGLLNGLMPCGPLQSMQLYALGTGSFAVGAGSMFFFSLGTVPLMFGLGAASSLLSRRFTQKMLKASAVLVVVLGLIMLNRGMSLTGITLLGKLPTRTESASPTNIGKIVDNQQHVATELFPYGYTPIKVKKGIPVRWTIKADQSNLNGCNRVFVIPEYNLRKVLVPGENIVEFTPVKEGKITYTCWMGMIASTIEVVENL